MTVREMIDALQALLDAGEPEDMPVLAEGTATYPPTVFVEADGRKIVTIL